MKYKPGWCSECVCDTCLYWWSMRCPLGGRCFDDYRAKVEPFPGPVRKMWTDWDKPGEQAHWCRGGTCYPVKACEHYVAYERDKTYVKTCLDANVTVFQDGHMWCSIVDTVGCEECYRRFEERLEQA